MSQSAREEVARAGLQRIVLALPEGEVAEDLADAFVRAGYQPHRVGSPEATTLALAYREPAAILIDGSFLQVAGFQLLDSVRISAPGVPVIVTTDANEEQLRLKALVLGAEDCLVSPFAGQEAVIRVRRALDRREGSKRAAAKNSETMTLAQGFKRDAAEIRQELRRNLTSLQRAVDFHRRLEPDLDTESLRTAFLRNLSTQLSVDRLAYLAPAHESASWMVARSAVGLPDRLLERVRIHAAGELASVLKTTAGPVLVDRLSRVPSLRIDLGLLAAGGFTAAIPLVVKSELIAVVLLGETRGGGAPSEELLGLGQFLASALVPLLAARDLWDREREMSAQTLGVLITQMEAGNQYLKGHSVRVSRLAEQLALRLGLRGADLKAVTTAGLLHDLGRFEADLSLWSKPGPLSAADWQAVQRHPEDGARLLAEAAWPGRVQQAVLHHHESWDGTGYPHRIRGGEIPLDARVLAVADALDALTSPRPYRPARSQAEAVRILRSEAGTKFDPELVALVVDETQVRA